MMACLRNRDERFPLNATPSVLSFMKKFGPGHGDKPDAGGGEPPPKEGDKLTSTTGKPMVFTGGKWMYP